MRTIASIIKTETKGQVVFVKLLDEKILMLFLLVFELIVVASTVSVTALTGD